MRKRTRRHVGFYVHDRGEASVARVSAALARLDADVTLLSARPSGSLPEAAGSPVVPLPPSLPDVRDAVRGPRDCEISRARTRAVLDWTHQEDPDLLVVDGCAALAGVAHLAGVPTVGVRPLGAPWPTWDPGPPMPMIAPYPQGVELAEVPPTVREHTAYVGAYSPLDGRPLDRASARAVHGLEPEHAVVTVVTGPDGLGPDVEQHLLAAADRSRRWRWIILGRFDATDGVVPDNMRLPDHSADRGEAIAAADVVVSTGGDATVAAVASLRRPHVIVQEGAHDRERYAAVAQAVRHRIATALPLWPAADDWAELLGSVRTLDVTPQERFNDHRGADRAAAAVSAWAAGSDVPDSPRPEPPRGVGRTLRPA